MYVSKIDKKSLVKIELDCYMSFILFYCIKERPEERIMFLN